MATDLQQTRPAPSPKKYEAFVETQLARARNRIRSLDLSAAGLGWLALTLAYGLILAVCDRWLELSPLARQIAFGFYAAGSLAYVGVVVVRPLCRQINPYYAARRLEETIPEAKNSVVNWLDLHQQAIAPAFRSAISHQAAKDLADADLEQAISVRRASWLGAGVAALFFCMLILFVLGPRQFVSLMNRAFAPFVEASIATRTRILVVRPEDGDVIIPVGRAVEFSVWVEGRVPEPSSPDALKLLYRYNLSDPYQTRVLERGESSREWFTSLLASEVHNGLWYKIAGGDAETAEYRVQVRSTPLLTGFDVTYHYRPYLGWPDRTTHDQNLQDLRGTEVTLLARANRTVKDGQLGIDGQKAIAAELVPEDRQVLRFRLRLENDGSYRIWFRSVEGETNIEPMAYSIRVLHDHPPQVELTKPGEDGQLPASGVLRLEGSASDDFGIAGVNLRMKLENGALLQSKPYRKGQTLRRGDGSYPQMLAYRDFVELDKLHKEDGQPLEPLRPGAKLEYWLEGTDNCDYPGPNMGESKHFKVTIQPPDRDQKKEEQQRQQAQQEQQQHEKKQDQDLQNQQREPREGSQEQQQNPNDGNQPNKKNDQQDEQDLNKQKEKIQNAIKEHERQKSGDQGQSGTDKPQESQTGDKGQSRADKTQDSKTGDKGQSNADKPQESNADGTGNGQSQQQSGKPQDKGKEGGESKPQSNQDNAGGKQDARGESGNQKREGSGASESASGDRKDGTQRSERPDNQGMKDGNREQSAPAKNRDDGSNGPGSSGERQGQDQAKPQAGTADQRANPAKDQGTAGEKANAQNDNSQKQQNPGRGQDKGSKQGEEKKGQGEKAAQPNPEQGGAGERPDSRNDPSGGAKQEEHRGQGDKKSQTNRQNGNKDAAGTKRETGAEKTEKTASGQEGSRQETGERKSEGREGADAGNAQQPNQRQQAGKEQGGERKNDGNAAARPEKTQDQGGAESRRDKTGPSQSESRAGEKTPQREPKTGDGQGEAEEKKETDKTGHGARENSSKSQEKPTGEGQGSAGDRATTKTGNEVNRQKPNADGSQGSDKARDKGRSDAGSGQDDKNRAQQSKPGNQGDGQAGDQSKNEVSKLSKGLEGRDEKGRADARKKLEDLRDHAKDPAVRKAAADALDHAGQDRDKSSGPKADGTQQSADKGKPQEKPSSESHENSPGDEKGKGSAPRQPSQNGKGERNDQSDSANDRPEDGKRTDRRDDSKSKSGDRGNQAPSSSQPGGSGSGRRSGDNPTGQAPQSDRPPADQVDRQREPAEPGSTPNPAYQKQAGELQLEDIKKKINKDVLKQLNMTEADFQKFVKAYDEMLKRKQPPGTDKENLAGPQRGNRLLPNQNIRAVAPEGQAKGSTLQRIGPALAPPEFRDAYKEFSKRISELEAKEKK